MRRKHFEEEVKLGYIKRVSMRKVNGFSIPGIIILDLPTLEFFMI